MPSSKKQSERRRSRTRQQMSRCLSTCVGYVHTDVDSAKMTYYRGRKVRHSGPEGAGSFGDPRLGP